MMTEQEKMEGGQLYDASAPELLQKLFASRNKLFELNYRLLPSQTEERERLLRDILGTTPERFTIVSPFLCDYGHNIHLGRNFFANYNCVMLDEAPITIGDNVLIAPNVGLYTAGATQRMARVCLAHHHRQQCVDLRRRDHRTRCHHRRQHHHRRRQRGDHRYSVQRHRRRKPLPCHPTRHRS